MKQTAIGQILIRIAAVLLFSPAAYAQNPILPGLGVSDPHVRVFEDKLYLYSGHDDKPIDPLWVMKDWRVFSSTDLLNWNLETTIYPKDNYLEDDSINAWAGDAATRNGKYYFYFSDRDRSAGVMESDSPGGPFVDKLGGPLVDKHDPTVFIDDDENQTPYIIYGDKHIEYYHIAELNDDMSSLAEKPKRMVINGQQWKDAPKWQDKNYLFKRKGIYYLSWGRDYATSKNIYGPYNIVGSVGEGHNLDAFAHGSFFEWKGQFYHIWCYYIKNGFKFRETIITYTHFTDDGKIVTDTKFLDKHFATGVGQYDSNWSEIEAEWFYEKSANIIKKEKANDGLLLDGFILENIDNGAYLVFPNIKGLDTNKTIIFNLQPSQGDISKNSQIKDQNATKNETKNATQKTRQRTSIEIRKNSPTGKLLATCDVPMANSTNATEFIDVSCELPAQSATTSLSFVFKGQGTNLLKLNKFMFKH